jgi:hypothetical protein
VRVSAVLLFALAAFGCAGGQTPPPLIVERIYYLPAPPTPSSGDGWCPPGLQAEPRRKRNRIPSSSLGARPPRDHGGHGQHASGPPRKPSSRSRMPPNRHHREKPRRPLRAAVPSECTGPCRERAKERERECRRDLKRSRVEDCIERLERELERDDAPRPPNKPHKPKL